MWLSRETGHTRQVQRTELFNLIFKFDRVAAIYVKLDPERKEEKEKKPKRYTDLSNFSSTAKFMDFHTDPGRPIRSRSRVYLSSRSVSPGLSRSPLVFSPLSSFQSFFLGPVVDVLCHASYFHARTRRLHLLKAIHYDSKIISFDSSRRRRGRHPIKSLPLKQAAEYKVPPRSFLLATEPPFLVSFFSPATLPPFVSPVHVSLERAKITLSLSLSLSLFLLDYESAISQDENSFECRVGRFRLAESSSYLSKSYFNQHRYISHCHELGLSTISTHKIEQEDSLGRGKN